MTNDDFGRGRQLRRLAVSVVLGAFRPDEAVELASSLVADGSESDAALELAVMPQGAERLSRFEVEPVARRMLGECGVVLPSKSEAGWAMAGFLAEAMIDGEIDPAAGADAIWQQWEICGEPGDELIGMLQLHDVWEISVGDRRTAIEAEMVAYARTVLAAAERHAHS